MYLRSIAQRAAACWPNFPSPSFMAICGGPLTQPSTRIKAFPTPHIPLCPTDREWTADCPGGFTASHFLIADHSKSKRTPERERATDRPSRASKTGFGVKKRAAARASCDSPCRTVVSALKVHRVYKGTCFQYENVLARSACLLLSKTYRLCLPISV